MFGNISKSSSFLPSDRLGSHIKGWLGTDVKVPLSLKETFSCVIISLNNKKLKFIVDWKVGFVEIDRKKLLHLQAKWNKLKVERSISYVEQSRTYSFEISCTYSCIINISNVNGHYFPFHSY